MGWETRSGHSYYYRKVRRGGCVVSEYVGKGALSKLVDRRIAINRHASQSLQAIEQRSRAEFAELDSLIEANEREIRAVLAATLIVNGYHSHKGQWRKKRQPRR